MYRYYVLVHRTSTRYKVLQGTRYIAHMYRHEYIVRVCTGVQGIYSSTHTEQYIHSTLYIAHSTSYIVHVVLMCASARLRTSTVHKSTRYRQELDTCIVCDLQIDAKLHPSLRLDPLLDTWSHVDAGWASLAHSRRKGKKKKENGAENVDSEPAVAAFAPAAAVTHRGWPPAPGTTAAPGSTAAGSRPARWLRSCLVILC